MKTIIKTWNSIPTLLKIVVGLAIGILLGIVAPDAAWISIFGEVFVGALKAIAPILVFILICASLSKAKPHIGKRFGTVILLYMVTTLTAAIVAVAASYAFPVSITLEKTAQETAPAGLGEVFRTLLNNMMQNPLAAIIGGNYIGILFWAVVFGLCLKAVAKESTIEMVSDLSDAVSKGVAFVISFVPFGVMGLVFDSVSQNGLSIFTEYGMIILVLVGAMVFSSLVINPLIVALFIKRNPYPLVLTCLRESGITAFFTRSSAANIPMNMRLCEKLGIEKDFYSVSIPLGATINMDGAAITITVMTMAACHTLGYPVNPLMALVLCVLSVLGACGASGVAGGSLLLIPMACGLFGIGSDAAMQVVAVGFIIGVIQDSVETALNSSGDAIFTAAAEYHDRIKAGEDMKFLGEFAKK